MNGISAYIQSMPKIELHCHLDGSVSPRTLIALADRQRMELPTRTVGGLERYLRAPEHCASLTEYLRRFEFVLRYLQTGSALELAAQALVQEAAAEHVRYIEVRFAPLLHTALGLSPKEAVESVWRGLSAGERDYGVAARAILIGMRDRPAVENVPLLKLAEDCPGVVGVDIAGDELHHPTGEQTAFLAEAARRGIPFTVHAGESGPAGNIADALELGAARIGHGVRLEDDPALLERVRAERIPLEMCPTSNLQTKAVRDWQSYPIRTYFDRGLAVTVHSDNRTVSHTSLTREYQLLVDHWGFTPPMLACLVRNAVEAAFLPPEKKQELRDGVEQALSGL